MRVVPYIETIGSDKFKSFLNKEFDINMLFNISNSCDVLFEGWRGKDMGNWYRFKDDRDVILEFYGKENYVIQIPKTTVKYTISYPKTLNMFINDMDRHNVQLHWGEWMNENFEPKEYLHEKEISEYFINLLAKMGKSHELNL